jgi:TM2 domain-containing membrane protein YozV
MKKFSKKLWLFFAIGIIGALTFGIIIGKVDDIVFSAIMYGALYIGCIIIFLINQIRRNKKFSKNQNTTKDWTTVLSLLFLFGIFGGHRFYVGKTGTGILMLLMATLGLGGVILWISCFFSVETGLLMFFTTVIPLGIGVFIWWIIDLVSIGKGKFKDKDGHVLKKPQLQTVLG